MGSDWIHHGEESYPEAAWLQLEVLIIAQRGLTCYGIKNAKTDTLDALDNAMTTILTTNKL